MAAKIKKVADKKKSDNQTLKKQKEDDKERRSYKWFYKVVHTLNTLLVVGILYLGKTKSIKNYQGQTHSQKKEKKECEVPLPIFPPLL